MISVICSTQYENDNYRDYLKNSSGIKDVEVLMYVNDGQWSLAEIYNRGMQDSKYDIVVFVHDDLEFDTKNWGRKVVQNFSLNPDYSIFGVAGAPTIGESGCWWDPKQNMRGIVNHTDGQKKWTSNFSVDVGNQPIPVVVLDGLFIAVHKDPELLPFDEDFTGFHFYDIPFTFRNYVEGFNIAVFTNIRITHLSVGQTNQQWELNRQKFVTKYNSNLPLVLDENN